MKAIIETITPERAAELLKSNTANYRRLMPDRVKQYADDLSAGLWQLNGETIKISSDGVLFDGQHRLAAIVKSGCPMRTFVVYGVQPSMNICDVGMGRTATQLLKAEGFASPISSPLISGGAAIIISGRFDGKGCSKPNLLSYLARTHDYWVPISSFVRSGRSNAIAKKAVIAAAAYCLYRTGEMEYNLRSFFECVNSGFSADFRESSPAFVLRNFLLQDSASASNKEWRILAFSVTIQAFYDFKASERRRQNYKFKQQSLSLLDQVRELDGIIC